MTPPLIPPRGEVNAADAFDIGNFDDDEVKGVKVSSASFSDLSAYSDNEGTSVKDWNFKIAPIPDHKEG